MPLTHRANGVSCRRCQSGSFSRRPVRVALTSCLLLILAATAWGQDSAAPADTSLVVGDIDLDMEQIFTKEEMAQAEGFTLTLQKVMNGLHIKSRPWLIRQELLFKEGERFRYDLLEESERNLRSLGILNNIKVAPTDTTDAGKVNVRVTTHETWTLGLGISFALTSSGEARWSASLTEKNFLGTGLLVRGAIGDDLNARYGRIYLKQNRLFRTPIQAELNLDNRTDGHDRWFALSVPFRADDQTWKVRVVGWNRLYNVRYYLSNAGPAGEDPGRNQSLYASIPRAYKSGEVSVARRVSAKGYGRVWRLGLTMVLRDISFDLGNGQFYLSDGRAADLSYLQAPGSPMSRDTGLRVWPHLFVGTHGRDWIQTRFLRQYNNREDVALNWAATLRTGPSGTNVGSEAAHGDRWTTELNASNWDRVGRHFWLQSLSLVHDFGNDLDEYHMVDALTGLYLRFGEPERPYTWKSFLELVHGDRLRGDLAATLGLDRGLRTLDVDGMAGDRLLRWSSEIGHVLPWVPLGVVQTGWGVYYAGGLSKWDTETTALGPDTRHEIGVGLRLGGTRSGNSDLARVDLTYDLSGNEGFVITTVSRGYF